jgi:hypothetical protein
MPYHNRSHNSSRTLTQPESWTNTKDLRQRGDLTRREWKKFKRATKISQKELSEPQRAAEARDKILGI